MLDCAREPWSCQSAQWTVSPGPTPYSLPRVLGKNFDAALGLIGEITGID